MRRISASMAARPDRTLPSKPITSPSSANTSARPAASAVFHAPNSRRYSALTASKSTGPILHRRRRPVLPKPRSPQWTVWLGPTLGRDRSPVGFRGMTIVAETERLIIRPWTHSESDLDRVFDAYSRMEVIRYLGSFPKPMEARDQ